MADSVKERLSHFRLLCGDEQLQFDPYVRPGTAGRAEDYRLLRNRRADREHVAGVSAACIYRRSLSASVRHVRQRSEWQLPADHETATLCHVGLCGVRACL